VAEDNVGYRMVLMKKEMIMSDIIVLSFWQSLHGSSACRELGAANWCMQWRVPTRHW